MFVESGALVRITYCDGKTYTGTVYKTVIQLCHDDEDRPHALVFISQDKRFIAEEGDFGCEALWVDKIKALTCL